jgi:hypothetical protein
LPLNKMSSFTIDKAPGTIGSKNGFHAHCRQD